VAILVGVAALLAFGAMLVDGYVQAYRIGKQLEATYPKLRALRSAFSAGQIPDHEAFREAFVAVQDLRARMAGTRFTFPLTADVPFVGRPVRAVRLGGLAVDQIGRVAVLADEMLTKLFGPSGHTPLVHGGRIDVNRLSSILPIVDQVPGHLRAALADVKAIPYVPFFHRFESLRQEALSQVRNAATLSARAAAGFRLLPDFLGANGPRTYFIGFQNNADQRGTGGAVLAYGLIRVDRGRIELLRFGPINDLDFHPRPPHHLPPHSPASVRWYLHETHRLPRINNGLNYTPNFRDVGLAWSNQVQRVASRHIDGAIAVDPVAVAYALRDQGSFTIPAYAGTIDSGNVVQIAEHDQYALPRDLQNALPGQLVGAAFQLITNPRDMLSVVRNLGTALSEKRIQLWFRDPRLEDIVHRMGWDGALEPGPGDYLYLVQDKRALNKVDYFTRQVIDHTVRLAPSGNGTAVTKIRLVDDTPPGQVAYVAGPWHPYGLNLTMLNLFVPERSEHVVVRPAAPLHTNQPGLASVAPRRFVQHVEGDARVYTKHVEAWPGHPARLTYLYEVPSMATRLGDGTFRYVLSFQHQPAARAMQATVTVHLPPGSRILHADPAWTVHGATARFHGYVVKDLRAAIHYELIGGS
jgi:hypothetical protein